MGRGGHPRNKEMIFCRHFLFNRTNVNSLMSENANSVVNYLLTIQTKKVKILVECSTPNLSLESISIITCRGPNMSEK